MTMTALTTYALAVNCTTCTARVGERCTMRSSSRPVHSGRLVAGEALRQRDLAVAAALLTHRDHILKERCPTCLAAPSEPCHLHVGVFHQARVDRSAARRTGRQQ